MKFKWAEMYLLSGFKEWTRVDPSKSNLFSHTFIKAYLKRFLYIVKDNMVRVEVSCVYNASRKPINTLAMRLIFTIEERSLILISVSVIEGPFNLDIIFPFSSK